MDASKIGLSQVNSTAAELAGLDTIMYYSALLCPDMTAEKLELPNFKDGVTGMVLVTAMMSSSTIYTTSFPSSGANPDWHHTC